MALTYKNKTLQVGERLSGHLGMFLLLHAKKFFWIANYPYLNPSPIKSTNQLDWKYGSKQIYFMQQVPTWGKWNVLPLMVFNLICQKHAVNQMKLIVKNASTIVPFRTWHATFSSKIVVSVSSMSNLTFFLRMLHQTGRIWCQNARIQQDSNPTPKFEIQVL